MKWLFRRERADGYESVDGRPVARPTDLAALCGFVLVAVGVLVLWDPSSPPLRAIVGVPLIRYWQSEYADAGPLADGGG